VIREERNVYRLPGVIERDESGKDSPMCLGMEGGGVERVPRLANAVYGVLKEAGDQGAFRFVRMGEDHR
jgi:hypothetical protein